MAGLNKNNSAVKRILQEARELANDPSPEYSAAPLEDDIFEWHCTLRGPSGTEFEGGLYHFRILLPAEYPFRPPSIMMLTPSGRFETDTKICISFTSYHEELWQPAWGVRTAIIGLQGFFPLSGKAAVGIGSIEHPTVERKRLAQLSRTWTCPVCREPNLALLPDPVGTSSEQSAPSEPPAPVSTPSIPDAPLAAPPAPNSVAPPQVVDPPRPEVLQVKRQQRPPILLDTAICLILVLACGIVFRRMF
ncbi:non-canonical ubiquitin conjugating enzyme 1 [Mycena sanguinolenta]|nr:non-canonical ubiquitin conjugating enzyme 1 [Mycena sanguinolenta]